MGTAAADANLRRITSRAEVRAVTDAARRASMDAVLNGVQESMVEGVMAAIGKAGVVAPARKKRKPKAVAKAKGAARGGNVLPLLKATAAKLGDLAAKVNRVRAGVAEDEEADMEALPLGPIPGGELGKQRAKYLAGKAKAEAAERLLREEDGPGMEDVGLASAAQVGRQVQR